MQPRLIPVLLLKGKGFVKTKRFLSPTYLGDPINILSIFNEKEVDELTIFDIDATRQKQSPDFPYLEQMASQCFMPLAYGGGVENIWQIERLFAIGFEKVVLNSAAIENPKLISEASKHFGSQSIVVCIDAKKTLFSGYKVASRCGKRLLPLRPWEWSARVAEHGAGEIIINSIDRDGMMNGYDLNLIHRVAESVTIPVIACGGARGISDFALAVQTARASACAAGATFVFHGPHRAVLINVPSRQEFEKALL